MNILNILVNYFDLNNRNERITIQAATSKKDIFIQYLAVTLGILVQPLLEDYIKTNDWHVPFSNLLGRVIFSLFIGLAIFPAVYKNTWDENSPVLVQFCTIFSAGLGWQTLFSAGNHVIN